MKVHKITMLVKRVQYQEVEFSEFTGCNMPKNSNDLISMCEEIKGDPYSNCCPDKWITEDDIEIKAFDVVDHNEPSSHEAS